MTFTMKKTRNLRENMIPFIELADVKNASLLAALREFFGISSNTSPNNETANKTKASDQWGTPQERKMNALHHFLMRRSSWDLTPFEPNWCLQLYYNGLADYVPEEIDVWINPPFTGVRVFAERAEMLAKLFGCNVLMLAPTKSANGLGITRLNFKLHSTAQWSFAEDLSKKLDMHLSWYRFLPIYVQIKEILAKKIKDNTDTVLIAECNDLIAKADDKLYA
jgi:hypothetical protein